MRTTPTAPTPAPPPPTSTPRASWLDVAVGFHRAQQTHAVVLDQRAEVLSEHQPVLAIRIRIAQRMVHITLLIRPVDKIVAANALGLQLVIDILRTSTRKHLRSVAQYGDERVSSSASACFLNSVGTARDRPKKPSPSSNPIRSEERRVGKEC